jgi:glutamate--cysteine ligase regulatory subunit
VEAITCVKDILGIDKFDTLILSLPGIVLEKDEEDYNSKEFPVSQNTVDKWVNTWEVFLNPAELS